MFSLTAEDLRNRFQLPKRRSGIYSWQNILIQKLRDVCVWAGKSLADSTYVFERDRRRGEEKPGTETKIKRKVCVRRFESGGLRL